MTALLASTNSPRTGGTPAAANSTHTASYRAPTIVLTLVLLYTLIFAQIISGSAAVQADLDPAIYETASRSNAINQAIWFALLAFSIMLSVMRRIDPLQASRALLPLFAYLLWSAATLPWAVDHHIALRRLILQFCIVGSIWLPVAMIRDATHVRRILLYVLFVTVLANAAAAVVVKPSGLGYAGLFSQKNGLGAVVAMALVTFLFSFDRERSTDCIISVIGTVLSLGLLVVSKSKTSIILAAAVPLIAWAAAGLARSLRIRPAVIVLAVVIVSSSATIVALNFGLRSNTILHALFGGDTFTGRTAIWDFAWSEFLTRPLAGFGFNGFWGVGANAAATYSNNAFFADILQAHEGYLDILLETGLIGLVIFVALVLRTLRNCSRVICLRGGTFFLAMTLFFVLHNFFESSIFRRFEPIWVLFLIVATAAAVERPNGQKALRHFSREATAC